MAVLPNEANSPIVAGVSNAVCAKAYGLAGLAKGLETNPISAKAQWQVRSAKRACTSKCEWNWVRLERYGQIVWGGGISSPWTMQAFVNAIFIGHSRPLTLEAIGGSLRNWTNTSYGLLWQTKKKNP
jgi:hypothetical protein